MLARLARGHRARVRFVGIDTRGAARRHRLEYPHLFDPRTRLATRRGVSCAAASGNGAGVRGSSASPC